MTGLIVLNALLIAFTDANFPWVVFPLVGWGIGLAFHYVDVYRRPGRSIRSHQEEVERYATRPRATVAPRPSGSGGGSRGARTV